MEQNINIDMNQIAIIAEKVSSELDITIALISGGCTIIGMVFGILGQFTIEWYKERPNRKLDKQRMRLLNQLLDDKKNKWREIKTLSRVIGADENETKRLLIGIGARGSSAGNDVWALIKDQPLSNTDKD